MNLEQFLKSNLQNGYGLTTDIQDEDFLYTNEFKTLLKEKNTISFKLENNDLENNDFLTILTLINEEDRKSKNYLEFLYTNNSDDVFVNELYKMSNLLELNISLIPSENVVEVDYLNILNVYKEITSKETNKIKILPLDSFLSYYQLKLLVDNFTEINTENEIKITNLLHPTPSEYLEKVIFKYKDINFLTNVKNKFFDNITEEEKKEEINKISNLLSVLKDNLIKNKDFFNIYIK